MKKREIGLLILLLAIDLVTKQMIENTMTLGESIVVIENFFKITYAVNTGAAWSILEGKMIFFYLVTILGIAGIIYLFSKTKKEHTYTRFGLVLMFVGAVGNFYDRLVYQHVRDFLDFYIFGYDFPVFNVADMCLCIGTFVIILLILFKKESADELL